MNKVRVMLSWGRKYLTPPIFEDEGANQLARLLHPILLFSAAANGLTTLVLLALPSDETSYITGIVGLATVCAVVFFVLLRLGYVRFVGYGLALSVWLACTLGTALMGGAQSPGNAFFVFPIVYAFLLFGHRAGMLFLGATVVTIVLLFGADHQGLLPEADPTPDAVVLIVNLLILIGSGWVVGVVTRHLRRSLTRARKAERQLRYKGDLQALVTQLATECVNIPLDEMDVHIHRALEAISRFVGADGCRLVLVSDDSVTLRLAHEWAAPGTALFPTPAARTLLASQSMWLLAQLLRMETVYVRAMADLPPEAQRLRTLWEQAAVQSALYMPLAVSGSLVGFLAFFTTHAAEEWTEDVTQLLTLVGTMVVQALERQTAEAQRHALIAERERITVMQEFIGNVTHDIRNPLAVINTSLYVARYVNEPERRAASLSKIETQVDRISALVEDLLVLARLDTDHPMEMEVVDVKRVLEEVVAQQRPLADEKQLVYEVSLPPALPPVLAHAGDIRRVFVNLLENAIRYTLAGCSISVRANADGETVVVEVTDTGIGIPASDLPHVFDRFFRSENARAVSDHGTGLGLAIVRRIVDTHGGSIVVESEEGRGSTFRVTLPRWDGAGAKLVGF